MLLIVVMDVFVPIFFIVLVSIIMVFLHPLLHLFMKRLKMLLNISTTIIETQCIFRPLRDQHISLLTNQGLQNLLNEGVVISYFLNLHLSEMSIVLNSLRVLIEFIDFYQLLNEICFY